MKTNKDQRQKYTLMKRYDKVWDRLKPAFLAQLYVKLLPELIFTISSIISFGQY
jgi:hypothetical protein